MNSSPTPGYTFGMRLRCIRNDHHLSQKKMAESVGVSATTWSSYEHDNSFPSESTLWNLCGVYHVNQEWLYENHGNMYLDNYKPSDPLGEPVSYSEKLKQDIQNIMSQHCGFSADDTCLFLEEVLGEIEKKNIKGFDSVSRKM